jgi:hypothetical protein
MLRHLRQRQKAAVPTGYSAEWVRTTALDVKGEERFRVRAGRLYQVTYYICDHSTYLKILTQGNYLLEGKMKYIRAAFAFHIA